MYENYFRGGKTFFLIKRKKFSLPGPHLFKKEKGILFILRRMFACRQTAFFDLLSFTWKESRLIFLFFVL